MSAARLLDVHDLRVHLGAQDHPAVAVDGVSFSLQRGETLALLGESGCGKSITALSILRLLPPSGRFVGGEVRLGDTDLLRVPEARMQDVRGRRIAMIFQEPQTALNPVLSIGTQIGEVLRRHTALRGAEIRRRSCELLDSVGIPEPERRCDEYPHQLSGGMKQRVMIAMALAGEPDVLIADEPTTALDVTIQAQVLELLREIKQRTGMAMILITHDLGVVAEMADRVAVMYAGQIIEQADRESFLASPQHPYSRKLFAALPDAHHRGRPLTVIGGAVPSLTQEFTGCKFEPRCEWRMPVCATTPPAVNEPCAGRQVRCHLFAEGLSSSIAPLEDVSPSRPVSDERITASEKATLIVEDLDVYFPIQRGVFKKTVGQVYAVDGVTMTIPAATTLALVGESGCGKTTVGKGIVRLIEPTAGKVTFGDVDLRALRGGDLRRMRRDIQFIFQDPFASMNPRMTIADIVAEGMIAQGLGGDRQSRRREVQSLLHQVGIDASACDRYPHEFSGGQRQRICIARALAVKPKLIICDEPTSALDVSVQAQILNLLKSLQDTLGLSYLFITHNLAVVEYLAHRVAVMYLGRIVEEGTVEEVFGNMRHPYTQALLSAVPSLDPESGRERVRLSGELPSPSSPPAGCHFHPRCPLAEERCRATYPEVTRISQSHSVRCHLVNQTD
jgi:peptide/nickel transport system ATP-binding protein